MAQATKKRASIQQAEQRDKMIKNLTILQQAGALARHAAARHNQIAENIANADTPGYKAKDLPKFDPKAVTADADSNFGSGNYLLQAQVVKGLEASPNGNTVNLGDQMVRAADAQSQHDAALTLYRKTMDLLRLSVSSR